jgi:hypothetical protein
MTRDDMAWVWDRIGFPGIALLFVAALFIGYLPSPLTELQAESVVHKQDTKKSLREHRKQTRLMLESCIDSKVDHKKDPASCLRMLEELGAKGEPQE